MNKYNINRNKMIFTSSLIYIALLINLFFSTEANASGNLDALTTQLENASGEERINLLLELSDSIRSESPEKALHYAETALKQSKINGSDDLIAKSYLKKGTALVVMNELEEAINTFQKGLGIEEEDVAPQTRSLLFNNLGYAQYLIGDYFTSMNNYSLSLAISDKYEIQSTKVRTLFNMGTIYEKLGDYYSSVESFEKALDISVLYNHTRNIMNAYNGIGNSYLRLGYHEKALYYYKKGLDLSQKYNYSNQSFYYTNIGLIHLDNKEFEKAEKYFNKSLEFDKKSGNKLELSISYLNLGILYTMINSNDEALQFLNKALTISNETHNKKGIADANKSLGFYYINKDQKKAIDYYITANEYYKRNELNSNTAECLYELVSLYSKVGNDSLLNLALIEYKATIQAIDLMEKEYLADATKIKVESEKAIAESKKKIEMMEAKIEYQYLIFILTLIIIIVSVIALARHWITNKKLKSQNSKLLAWKAKQEKLNNLLVKDFKNAYFNLAVDISQLKDSELFENFNNTYNEISSKYKDIYNVLHQ